MLVLLVRAAPARVAENSNECLNFTDTKVYPRKGHFRKRTFRGVVTFLKHTATAWVGGSELVLAMKFSS